jgi:hypothetical protein
LACVLPSTKSLKLKMLLATNNCWRQSED